MQTGYIVKFDSTGKNILYATYLGGVKRDCVYDIAVDSKQCLYVTGTTYSRHFPTTSNAYNSEVNPGFESFFTIIDTSVEGNAKVLVSSYLGGSEYDSASSIALDNEGNIYIYGITNSPDYPTTPNAFDKSLEKIDTERVHFDTYLSVFDPSGTKLIYSTFIGGNNTDLSDTIAIDSEGFVYLQGKTESSDFLEPYEEVTGGSYDFIIKLNGLLVD